MDIRYSANQKDFGRYTTREIRDEFLIERLFRPDEVFAVYSHADRMVTMGIMPRGGTVPIDKGIDVWKSFGGDFFLENREIGIFNLGGAGKVFAAGETYKLGYKDCLYIGRGARGVGVSRGTGGG
ncbi:MAG: 5-dehydro-4-deoxy-D-glucuronate isomerase, partial [Oscillospiraceae bacterium]|nr:5-dehydro-4-deoxy-D-glucuronate isomerase [Oscillospiraceae bacterium]